MQNLPSQTVKVLDQSPEEQGFIRQSLNPRAGNVKIISRAMLATPPNPRQDSPKLTVQAGCPQLPPVCSSKLLSGKLSPSVQFIWHFAYQRACWESLLCSMFPVTDKNPKYHKPPNYTTLDCNAGRLELALVVWSLPLVGFDISFPILLSGVCRPGLEEYKSMPIPT